MDHRPRSRSIAFTTNPGSRFLCCPAQDLKRINKICPALFRGTLIGVQFVNSEPDNEAF